MKTQTRNLGLTGIALAGSLMVGCGPEETIKMQTESEIREVTAEAGVNTPNYSVRRVAVFGDDLAYNEKRGIYEIIDNKTGRKYIGISGIGVSELGSHYESENKFSDER